MIPELTVEERFNVVVNKAFGGWHHVREREERCATMDLAEKFALIRALQEIRDALEMIGGDTLSPRDIVQAVRELRAEAEQLHRVNEKRVEAWLNEQMCCDGRECGCMGVTRLEQIIAEGAGQRITALRAEVERLTTNCTQLQESYRYHDARAETAEAELAKERARKNWLNTVAGMDWMSHIAYGDMNDAEIDAAMKEDGK